MCIKAEFNQEYKDIYDVKSIENDQKGLFLGVKKVLLLAGENIQQFLATGMFHMASLSEKDGKSIIKCRIKKPWCWSSEWYRAVFFYNLTGSFPTSQLLLLYSKNHCPDNVQETQWIWNQLKKRYRREYDYFQR